VSATSSDRTNGQTSVAFEQLEHYTQAGLLLLPTRLVIYLDRHTKLTFMVGISDLFGRNKEQAGCKTCDQVGIKGMHVSRLAATNSLTLRTNCKEKSDYLPGLPGGRAQTPCQWTKLMDDRRRIRAAIGNHNDKQRPRSRREKEFKDEEDEE
jgi:hypothetical protein